MDTLSYRWTPLRDLPADKNLANAELATLRSVWLEQKHSLDEAGLISPFLEKLIREYAIEGGIIERAYTLDRGITQLLIEKGIEASLIPRGATNKDPEFVARMIRSHQNTVEGVFDMVKANRPLSTSAIKQLHAILLEPQSTTRGVDTLGREVEVPLLKGDYKRWPNNPSRGNGSVHEYCPPEHVASEMDRLLQLHGEHTGQGVAAEVEAAWIHHVFTQIHPFQDGNGRVARLLASFVLIKADYFPLTLVDGSDRESYIASLEKADQGDLQPLVQLFAAVQRRVFVRVLGLAGQVQQRAGIDRVIEAARSKLVARKQVLLHHLENAKRTARALHQQTCQRLEQLKAAQEEKFGIASSDIRFRVDNENNEGRRRHYFKHQVIQAAGTLGYFANIGTYHDWVRLTLRAEEQSDILVSFHGLGNEFRGVIVASVTYFRRAETAQAEPQVTDTVTACADLFQINYLETPEAAQDRFAAWLTDSLTRALEVWRAEL